MRRIDEIIVHCTASPEGQEMTVKQIDSIHRNERHWADGRFIEIRLSQAFLEYGLWQDFGMGKEIPRSNNGDIGREKKRVTKKCFSKNTIPQFLTFATSWLIKSASRCRTGGQVAKSLDDKYRRYNH